MAIAIPGIINVCIISFIFYVMFGVIGLNYLKGRLYFCNADFLFNRKEAMNMMDDKWDCINLGGAWENYFKSFDNI